ncbi:MAG: hypothetical protein QW734_07900 [Candidatus Bathyarchaeia archaeon]
MKNLKLSLEYEVEVRDKNGQLLDHKKGESHTWVKNFIQVLKAYFSAGSEIITDTSGASRTVKGYVWAGATGDFYFLSANAPANNDAYGIQVGGSDAPFSRTQYALGSKISHGTGSGQLVYGASTVESVVDEDTASSFRITRVFTNNSGASVVVREIGIAIYYRVVDGSTAVSVYFLAVRDLLPSPSSIPDGATMTVRYKVRVSYA